MEASALRSAGGHAGIALRSPLLRLQSDERLVLLLRQGNEVAFEAIVHRYRARLLGFCRQMLGSTEDGEDALQEIFANAHRAMRADEREIVLRPWLYRIARNRCLNHLRRNQPPTEGEEAIENVAAVEASSTHERVGKREEFRELLADLKELPETQRTALLLREIDELGYEEIAQAMEATVPAVRSLLIRARTALAEASQARRLTCAEVRVELLEVAQGLRKLSGPGRRHARGCPRCAEYRDGLRKEPRALAGFAPLAALAGLRDLIASKLGWASAGSAGGVAGGAATAGGLVASKAAAGAIATAIVAAGAFSVQQGVLPDSTPSHPALERAASAPGDPSAVAPAADSRPLSDALAPAAATARLPLEEPTGAVSPQEEIVPPAGDPVEAPEGWEPAASEAAAIGAAAEDGVPTTGVSESPAPTASTACYPSAATAGC